MNTAAILTIGTELTRGELNDTNGSWLSERLTSAGIEVTELVSVPDEANQIIEQLQRLGQQHRLVICTGGLGPTSDDLTAACVARAAGVALVRRQEAIEHMEALFRRFRRHMPAMNRKQADLPAGSLMLPNEIGTAPGFACHLAGAVIIGLPGVPREVKHLWTHHVARLVAPLGLSAPFYQTNLRTFGAPESDIAETLQDLEQLVSGVTIAYRASAPEIEVKFLARASSLQQAKDAAIKAQQFARQRLGRLVFGEDNATFVSNVADAVRARGYTLALAESCTGGLISEMLTSEPASDYFVAGLTTYANEAKEKLLGVPPTLLIEHGAVSPQVAEAMAQGVRRSLGTDLGVGVTGIAGPTGGTDEKPVGLVYWAVAHPEGIVVRHRVFPGDRARIQRWAAYAALGLVTEVCTPPAT